MKEDKIKDELEKIDLKLTDKDIESGEKKLKLIKGQKKDESTASFKIDESEFEPPSGAGRPKGSYRIKKEKMKEVYNIVVEERGLKTRVCRRIGVSMPTLYKMIERDKKLKRAFELATEKILDIAESALIEKILARDYNAIQFFLKTIGAKRGYTEKVDVKIPERPIIIMKKKEEKK